MTYQHDSRSEIAKALDALSHPLFDALENIDRALARMSEQELFDKLSFVRKYGDLSAPDHTILLEKLERANAAASARGDGKLGICLGSDPTYHQNWRLVVFDGHVDVISREIATYDEAKAAGDALFEFLSIAGRADQFEYETPRPDGCTDTDDEIPF